MLERRSNVLTYKVHEKPKKIISEKIETWIKETRFLCMYDCDTQYLFLCANNIS